MESQIDSLRPVIVDEDRQAIALKAASKGDEALISRTPPGVTFNSPDAYVKNREHIFYLFP